MSANVFRTNKTTNLTKFRIIKNLIVISLSFLFLSTGDEGLLMLQTTINKEGVGTATMATYSVTFGISSLLFSSFIVKKFGSKNSQVLGILLILPFIVSNAYPMWITMVLSGILRGIGKCLHWAAQCTYFNESSVLYCKIENNRKSIFASNCKNVDVHNETTAFKSCDLKVEKLSASDLLNKTEEIHTQPSYRNSTICSTSALPIRLTSYKCGLTENQLCSEEKNEETSSKTTVYHMKRLKDFQKPKAAFMGEEDINIIPFNVEERKVDKNYQPYVDSTKAFFFGIHGLAYNSSTIWSNLISYYILNAGDTVSDNKVLNKTCGAKFCFANDDLDASINDVPDFTRQLLMGIYMASAIVSPLLMLFLDGMPKTTKAEKFSLKHVFATIKYIKKKDQLLMIPFTIGSCLCRGFYIADFTKFYIACAWNTSHIGLITIIFGTTAALSSICCGRIIKYLGRISVLVLCQLMTIANFVFLFFWNPNSQHSYMFYVQGSIFGMMSGIYNSQINAFYGVLFEGDEATAFSSCILYSSIGWALPFIYNDFFCVSVKICIVLAFSCAGLIGYLLAERSYSLRNQRTSPSN